MSDDTDLAALSQACETDPGDPELWFQPDGYPDSLALCSIDSIYSTGAQYSSVVNMVGSHRDRRNRQGGDPDRYGTVAPAIELHPGSPPSQRAADIVKLVAEPNGRNVVHLNHASWRFEPGRPYQDVDRDE